MNVIASRLLEAHVDFEMNLLKEENLRQTIETRINSAWENLENVPVRNWVSVELLLFYMKRYVVDFPISGAVTEIIGECSRRFLSFPVHSTTQLKDIFDRELWDYIVEKSASMESFRESQFHRITNSQVFTETLSDAIYNGIKSYLLEENLLMKAFPQLSSFLQQGKKTAVKGRPEVESTVQESIKRFIADNIERKIQRSEKYVSHFFTKDRLMDYGDEIWDNTFHLPLAEHFSQITEDDMEDFIIFGYEFWTKFRKTPFFEEVYTEIIHIIFEMYQDFSVPEMLVDLGFTKSILVEEGYQSLAPVIKTLQESERLERFVRAHLESFYQSSEVDTILKT